ncbi:MAG: hypothetical protein J5857_04275 [Treponema sp.]|nr:hypothetical protein [Treponema sp.]
MKKVKYPNLEDYDLSAYEELKGDILYRINGGKDIENTNDAVANAEVGDKLVRDDGTEVTITQGDITWAREHGGKVNENSSAENNNSSNNNSGGNGGTSTKTNNNSSSNTGSSTGGSSTTATSGNNMSGKTNGNAGNTPVNQVVTPSSKPKNEVGVIKLNTVAVKTINGCEIECSDNKTIIRVPANDKNAMKEAEDKFLAYTNEGLDCKLEVYTANGSARVFSKYSDFYDELHPKQESKPLYENEYLKIEAGKVTGGYKLKDTTPWEVDASALELSTSNSWEFFEVSSSCQALNLEGSVSYASLKDPGLSISAKASILDLEGDVSFRALGYKVTVSPGVSLGSIGGEISVSPNGFKFGVACGIGGGIGVTWGRE